MLAVTLREATLAPTRADLNVIRCSADVEKTSDAKVGLLKDDRRRCLTLDGRLDMSKCTLRNCLEHHKQHAQMSQWQLITKHLSARCHHPQEPTLPLAAELPATKRRPKQSAGRSVPQCSTRGVGPAAASNGEDRRFRRRAKRSSAWHNPARCLASGCNGMPENQTFNICKKSA